MKAVDVKGGKGDANALFINDDVADPTPTGDRILIKTKAFGLNRMDIFQREGKYSADKNMYSLLPESGNIMGVELSGVVDQLGPECTYLVQESLRGLI